MQIFLPYKDIIKVAECLDKRRLHKQIIECKQIIKAITGESEAWKNHPIVKMYSNNLDFVKAYLNFLQIYWNDEYEIGELDYLNNKAKKLIPNFINEEYLNTMKGRLYVKNPVFYVQFAPYEKYGDKNMYFVDGEWKIYPQK